MAEKSFAYFFDVNIVRERLFDGNRHRWEDLGIWYRMEHTTKPESWVCVIDEVVADKKIAQWNARSADRYGWEVQAGDILYQVNNANTLHGVMQEFQQAQIVLLRFYRYPVCRPG